MDLGASETVGGLCHAAERHLRWAAGSEIERVVQRSRIGGERGDPARGVSKDPPARPYSDVAPERTLSYLSAHETLFWTQDHYRVVRHQGWKLQRNGLNDEFVWLFDLNNDPTEQRNLANERPNKVAELDAVLTAHLAQQVPPRWSSRASGPISIDKHLNEPEAPDDEFVYYPN